MRCIWEISLSVAHIVSEDPLMRPSLLAMSLGISEVHTVVMKRSNWESAATLAKCFGRPDSLKVFQSLEALEKEVFELRIAEVLTGEVTPPHTCKGAENCGFQLNGDGTGSAPGNNEKHYNHDSNTGTAEPDENAKMLQAHLHRYRIVLIDDQYCGPIASAFGLPLLLEFVRTHTCPACCLVIPRRWQTLAAPASCPPLVPSGQYLKLVEGEKADELQQRRLATSGRTMTGTSIRIEDVALSSRFCVLESFEVNSLVRCSYKDPEVKLNLGLPTKDTRGSVNALKEGGSIKEDMDSWLPTSKTLRDKCLRCAKDRHLRWSKERLTVLNGNVVCGVEVAGACAGLIVRSHILVDEGITLFPSAPLMVFLPDEVQLSTRHVVMLGPGELVMT
ncbi:hypothetical protein, conserved [Eimeria praecox]|uniref:Uncharacterized protein n=1 Tax=Eimeria praecox TaxID=51316 RepID=U6H1C1_9EIME|nr:hypothetical protein, conserved [Eimeria praecox]